MYRGVIECIGMYGKKCMERNCMYGKLYVNCMETVCMENCMYGKCMERMYGKKLLAHKEMNITTINSQN